MSRANLPRVKGVAPAGEGAITLTLEGGEVISLTASAGTCMHPSGVLVSDYKNHGPVYFIPSPHQRWQAKVWLGLYGGEFGTDETRFDAYLMSLPSITEADWTGDVLTLAYLNSDGQRRFAQFAGDVSANFSWDPSDGGFTRLPLRVAVRNEKEDFEHVAFFRVDHTLEGYAALKALGWLAELPALEGVRPADHLNAA